MSATKIFVIFIIAIRRCSYAELVSLLEHEAQPTRSCYNTPVPLLEFKFFTTNGLEIIKTNFNDYEDYERSYFKIVFIFALTKTYVEKIDDCK